MENILMENERYLAELQAMQEKLHRVTVDQLKNLTGCWLMDINRILGILEDNKPVKDCCVFCRRDRIGDHSSDEEDERLWRRSGRRHISIEKCPSNEKLIDSDDDESIDEPKQT